MNGHQTDKYLISLSSFYNLRYDLSFVIVIDNFITKKSSLGSIRTEFEWREISMVSEKHFDAFSKLFLEISLDKI